MSKPKTKIYEIVALIEKHGPISPNALTELTGDFRQSIDRYVRLAHEAEMIHVDSFGPSPFGGNRKVKLYAVGKGIDAQRNSKKSASKKQKPVVCRRRKHWSEAEKRILREIKFGKKTVKEQLHRLPGRTLYGINNALGKMKGKKDRGFSSWVWTAILSTLEETPDLTGAELGEAIGCTARQVVKLLVQNHAETNRSVHISGWAPRNGSPARKWSLGNLPDAPRPALKEAEEIRARERVLHRMHRAKHNPFSMTVNMLLEAA